MGDVFQGLKVQNETIALIRDRLHTGDIADDVDARRVIILEVLLHITLARKEGLIVIRLPARAGIEDGLLIRKKFDGPLHIVHNRFSHISPSTDSSAFPLVLL
jgi:hypothetical protein